MTAILCPMLTALKPVDDAGQPVNRECIYEQCRFFHTGQRDCTLMMASRAMLRMSEEAAARPAAPANAGTGLDLDRPLTEMRKDLLNTSLEVQGVVREAAQATQEKVGAIEARIGAVEARVAEIDSGLERRLRETEERLGGRLGERLESVVRERLDEAVRGLDEALARRIAEAGQATADGLASVRTKIEERLRAAMARFEEQARALADSGTLTAQLGAQVGSLTELQQKIAERILEELSLVAATTGKLDQVVGSLEKKVEHSKQESLNLSQSLTLIKGETERTYAALRGIHEGNRAVIQAIETQLQRDQAELKRKRREEAQVCNNRGVMSYYRGAMEAAVEAFRQALKLQPDYSEAYNNLGLALSKLGQEKEAVEAFQEALKLDPNMGEVYNNLGFLYHTSAQFDRAAEMFGAAIQTAADSSIAYTNLGNTFYKMKQPDKAVESWRRALELDPMNENARRGLRMFQQEPSHN